MSSRISIIIGTLMALVLIFAIGQESILVIRDYLSRDNWVETSATVVRINSKTHWLTYQYDINGQDYIGTRLSFTEDSESEFDDRRDEYPEGTILTIYYDPADPSRAVISPTADFTQTLLVIGLIGASIIGYFIIKRLLQRYLKDVSNRLTGRIYESD